MPGHFFWFNPYVQWEATKQISSNKVHIGLVSFWNRFYRDNVKLSFGDFKAPCSLPVQYNIAIKHKGFFFSSVSSFIFRCWSWTGSNKSFIGYENGDSSVALTIQTSK